MELDVTDSVGTFRDLLLRAWPSIRQLSLEDTTGSFLDDWMQANWERIVESSIAPSRGVVLEPYGEGADCNINSSRVWRPNLLPNTSVYIRYLGNEPLINTVDGSEVKGLLKFSHFCTIKDGWPATDIPFDHAVLETDEVIAILGDNLRYYVKVEL